VRHPLEKSSLQFFGMRNNFYLGAKLNSSCYPETLRSLNAHLCKICPTRKISELLLVHDNARLHASVHIIEAITNFGWTVLLHPPYSADLIPSDYHLFGPFGGGGGSLLNTITPMTRHCRMLCTNGCGGGWAILSGGNRQKRAVDKDGDYTEK
jgi:hypothetical protein